MSSCPGGWDRNLGGSASLCRCNGQSLRRPPPAVSGSSWRTAGPVPHRSSSRAPWAETNPNRAAGIVDHDPGRPRLPARRVPGVLEADVRIDISGTHPRPGARLVPEARIELQLQLRIRPIAQLRDGRLLELVEAGLAVIQVPQDAERDGQITRSKVAACFPLGVEKASVELPSLLFTMAVMRQLRWMDPAG